jgi:hypothetical protein
VHLAPFVFVLPSKFLIFQLLMNATRNYLLVFYAACLTYNSVCLQSYWKPFYRW